ncbi:MAG: response regulator [Oscillospiraceae bacterium]|nr:response regulator [Oscillospiraceae bacterium]
MKILIADDERLSLAHLEETVEKAYPDAFVKGFRDPEDLLSYAGEKGCDIALLDIEMRSMNGVEAAQRLQALQPKVNIIFVTAHSGYTGDAMRMHASGYLLKPVTLEAVRRELCDLRYPVTPGKPTVLQIRCFGNFAVFCPDGTPVAFRRSKAKEALAYLVHLGGASCTVKELAAVLFEDRPYDKRAQGYIQKIISSMMATLKAVGAEEAILKCYNSLALNREVVDCDLYDCLEREDEETIRTLPYMTQYSWGEGTSARLKEGETPTKDEPQGPST